jgi:2-C-methyl-D-erythritol 4-phosphate cytidylyltransferase
VAAGSGQRAPAAALIVAAGSGERLGAGGPKALVGLCGRPMYEYSLEACLAAGLIGAVVIAVPPGQAAAFEAAAGLDRVLLVEGGSTRSRSVAAGLEAIDAEFALVHDAARPMLTPGLADGCIELLQSAPQADAVIAAAAVTDTVKRVGPDGAVVTTLDRTELRAVQTPQVFRRAALVAAIAAGDLDNATDDAFLIESAGGTVLVCDAPSSNLKVTVPEDLNLAELMLNARNQENQC